MYLIEFINKYYGKTIDRDKAYGGQCMDLYNQFQEDVLNVKVKGASNAKNVWTSFNPNVFIQIKNTLAFVPQAGDVAIWGAVKNNPYGHIAICTGKGNIIYFESFDQNWGGQYCHKVNHNYFNNFLGVLRPKDQNKIKTQLYQTYIIKDNNTNVRPKASLNNNPIRQLGKGNEISVFDFENGFLKTDIGYVHSSCAYKK